MSTTARRQRGGAVGGTAVETGAETDIACEKLTLHRPGQVPARANRGGATPSPQGTTGGDERCVDGAKEQPPPREAARGGGREVEKEQSKGSDRNKIAGFDETVGQREECAGGEHEPKFAAVGLACECHGQGEGHEDDIQPRDGAKPRVGVEPDERPVAQQSEAAAVPRESAIPRVRIGECEGECGSGGERSGGERKRAGGAEAEGAKKSAQRSGGGGQPDREAEEKQEQSGEVEVGGIKAKIVARLRAESEAAGKNEGRNDGDRADEEEEHQPAGALKELSEGNVGAEKLVRYKKPRPDDIGLAQAHRDAEEEGARGAVAGEVDADSEKSEGKAGDIGVGKTGEGLHDGQQREQQHRGTGGSAVEERPCTTERKKGQQRGAGGNEARKGQEFERRVELPERGNREVVARKHRHLLGPAGFSLDEVVDVAEVAGFVDEVVGAEVVKEEKPRECQSDGHKPAGAVRAQFAGGVVGRARSHRGEEFRSRNEAQAHCLLSDLMIARVLRPIPVLHRCVAPHLHACLAGLLLTGLSVTTSAFAATDVRNAFTLNSTDAYGTPVVQSRSYFVYRPDNLPRTASVPMVLVMDAAPSTGAGGGFFHRKADQAGFLVVSCSFVGNSFGTVWNSDDPRVTGWEDYDYISTVISRVRQAENGGDAFICGLSKGGHVSWAYACERPEMLKAACSLDEFMGITTNHPVAPIPILGVQGTQDSNVPYNMVRDSIETWRAVNGVLGVAPATTVEASPLQPGRVTQTTWRRASGGTPVALVTIIGGTHRYPIPTAESGYDCTDGLWAFFSQFLTPTAGAPRIVSVPVNNIQVAGQAASFWVSANGGAPLSYQWQRNGVDIPGATDNTYTVSAVTTADNGATYRAVVSNALSRVTSVAATLTVQPAPADPALTVPPADLIVASGQSARFAVTATGTAPLSYQWRKNGQNLPGATTSTLIVSVVLLPDSGALYSVVVTGAAGTTTGTGAMLTVLPGPGVPIMLAPVERQRVVPNQSGRFVVQAWSPTVPVSYQWQRCTFSTPWANIPGATAAAYDTPPASLTDTGTLYRCVVTNAAGSTASMSDMLLVTATTKSPTDITSALTAFARPGLPFRYLITSAGGSVPVTFAASALPPGLSVDAVSGAISGVPTGTGVCPVLVSATNPAGSISATVTLTVQDAVPDWGRVRLANLSTRGLVGAGERILIAGFVVQGTGRKSLLVRGIGPALTAFGVPGALAEPRISLLSAAGRTLLSAGAWEAAGAVSAGTAAMVGQRFGAFALASGSKDAAVVMALEPGAYTVWVEGVGGTGGVALVEIYDADPPETATSQLVNLSTRGLVGREANQMIAGFVIEGDAPRNVLIRAVGAATLGSFGVTGGLGDPALELADGSGTVVARNDDWVDSQRAAWLPYASSCVSAFALPDPGKDAVLLVSLAPGLYTAKVVNLLQPDGVALLEVYMAP